MHLSRWSEDLIIYSSGQFGMVKLSDAYSTGSSLMPQKKNPDALELLRGKSGRLDWRLDRFPHRDEGHADHVQQGLSGGVGGFFDTVDTMSDCLQIATGCLATLKIDPKKMEAGLSADMLATDLAEYLVRKGFRSARRTTSRRRREARRGSGVCAQRPDGGRSQAPVR